MQQLRWEIRNFVVGEHSDPARAGEGSERFAREAAGVRVDENGHLRPRVPIRAFGEDGEHAVVGVAAGSDYLIYLRTDGSLFIRFADTPEIEQEINISTFSQLSGMSG